MGMFDNIKCDYPLEGDDNKLQGWQTKDLQCFLEEYTISKEGVLLNAKGRREEYTGKLRFCTSNVSAIDYEMVFTAEGEDFRSVEYEAVFDNGVLTKAPVKIEDTSEPALAYAELQRYDEALNDEAEEPIDYPALVGKVLYHPSLEEQFPDLFKGEVGEPSTHKVVFANQKGAVLEDTETGELNIMDYFGQFFESREHFLADLKEKQESASRAKEHFTKLLNERKKVTQ